MSKKPKNAISPTREENYPEWYQQVIKASDMAENSPVRGCMIIKPWGWGIWERIQQELDRRIKESGCDNAYFPLFIPLSYLEKEAEHVDGFAKECAVVTHHRLEEKDGKLIPTGKLEEPLIVRPTSETIIGEAFSRWVQSYRDLPLAINQWANVVRWEMRPRLFLRTAEFLWQEGHTVHTDEQDALRQVHEAVEIYRQILEDILAVPVIIGEKSEGERFPGATTTISLEAMMQDGKALQAGTSHYLGTNFAKAAGIKFLDKEGEQRLAHTTSWGVSTRLIGGLIMSHGDDDGLKIPPRVAPKQVVILPVIPKPENEDEVLAFSNKVAAELKKFSYEGSPIRVHLDKRDLRGGEKSWQWIKKGIPLRIEVGPRDVQSNSVMVARRDKGPKDKVSLEFDSIGASVLEILTGIQKNYFAQAKSRLKENTRSDIETLEEFKKHFSENENAGFVKAPWSELEKESDEILSPLKVTVRCLPKDPSNKSSNLTCVLTGKPANKTAIFGRSY